MVIVALFFFLIFPSRARDAAVGVVEDLANEWLAERRELREERRRRAEHEMEESRRKETQEIHEIVMRRPVKELHDEASRTLVSLQGSAVGRPGEVMDRLDKEKFESKFGVWRFEVGSESLADSMQAKLASTGLPTQVAESVIDSVKYDSKVSMQSTDYKVDGRDGRGHLYSFKVRKEMSAGQASVALQAHVVSFDMTRVVDAYETKEEPVYETIAVRQLKRKGACDWRTATGEQCVFPFYYAGKLFYECTEAWSSSLWCATAVDHNVKMARWERCRPLKLCTEDEYETATERRFVRLAQTKLPVFSHRALPEGVTQSALMADLSMITSMEAQRVLSA